MNEYVIRYYGDLYYWQEASWSQIIVAFAYDARHKGGSASEGNINAADLKKLIEPFETEFIIPLNQELRLSPETWLSQR